MTPPKKKTPPRPIRSAAIVALLEAYVLGELKAKLNATQIKVALELLKLREAEKKRAAEGRLKRRGKAEGRDIDALLKELE